MNKKCVVLLISVWPIHIDQYKKAVVNGNERIDKKVIIIHWNRRLNGAIQDWWVSPLKLHKKIKHSGYKSHAEFNNSRDERTEQNEPGLGFTIVHDSLYMSNLIFKEKKKT